MTHPERGGTGHITVTEYFSPESQIKLLAERNEFRSMLMEIYTAHTSGALRMTSHRVGDPDNGIPMGPWHEEWMTGVREALGVTGDE